MQRILRLLYFASFWWGNYPTCKGTLTCKLFINANHLKLYQGTMCVLVLERSMLELWLKDLLGVYVDALKAWAHVTIGSWCWVVLCQSFCKNPHQIYIKTHVLFLFKNEEDPLIHKIIFYFLKTFNLFLLADLGNFL